MDHKHARQHGRHRGLAPALWVAAAVVALFTISLLAIVLFLHQLLTLAVELAASITKYLAI